MEWLGTKQIKVELDCDFSSLVVLSKINALTDLSEVRFNLGNCMEITKNQIELNQPTWS